MKKVLLHSCCAPCSASIIEWMLNNDIVPTVFFFNPNIYPEQEYLIRKQECVRYAEQMGIDFVDKDYDHESWLEKIGGLEDQPERGLRCMQCFRIRMQATALFAKENNFTTFTTTLAGSRWKNIAQIVEAGKQAALTNGVEFWDKDWKKGGLTERRRSLLQENNFYNQQYCGCEFSIRK